MLKTTWSRQQCKLVGVFWIAVGLMAGCLGFLLAIFPGQDLAAGGMGLFAISLVGMGILIRNRGWKPPSGRERILGLLLLAIMVAGGIMLMATQNV